MGAAALESSPFAGEDHDISETTRFPVANTEYSVTAEAVEMRGTGVNGVASDIA